MNYLFLIEKRVLLYLLLAVLTIWSISSSFMAFSNKERLVLVGIDENGTRIITSHTDPLFKTEVVNFIKDFSTNLYSFNSDNFIKKVGMAVDYMSSDVWKKEQARIMQLKEFVLKNKVKVNSEVLKISHIKDSEYEVVLDVKEKSKISVRDRKVKLKLQLARKTRSESNPWGMEIVEFYETVVN